MSEEKKEAFSFTKLYKENKFFIFFMIGMIAMRIIVVDWYLVPSSSMYPHLLEGDRVLSYKWAYDIKVPFTDTVLKKVADPQRGDIITLFSPEQADVRLIKRVIGVPGDVLEMRDKKLTVNGIPAEYQLIESPNPQHFSPSNEYQGQQLIFKEKIGQFEHQLIWMTDRSMSTEFDAITVPPDHYFLMGDNRDNSNDSRFYGFVKRELITGKASRILFSLDSQNYFKPRFDRFAASIAETVDNR